jgi:hypothetical protein
MKLYFGYFCLRLFDEVVAVTIRNFGIEALSGSVVTTAWRVLRLRMEKTAYRYGG